MKDILEADSIRCNFGMRQLLSDVYLKCEVGEVVGLLGRNGSGKSTLLKIIFGTQGAENRNIRINHSRYNPQPLRREAIAYLPQHNFLPDLKVKKAIAYFSLTKQDKESIFLHPHIHKLLDKNTFDLSGGQKRLVELMLLVHSKARFILLDEPFSAIEPLVKDQMKEIIKQKLTEKGFIITDHDYTHVLEIADNIVLLDNGIARHLNDHRELELYNYVPLGTFNL